MGLWTSTANDEGRSTDAMVDQGERIDAEGALADGGGVGDLVDQLEHTPAPDVGALLNASFFLDPVGVSPVLQVQSPSSVTDFGAYLFDDGSPVTTRLPATEGTWREMSFPVDSVVLSSALQGLYTV
mmetsp:Transcript_19224/g.28270  ORF Transcript_19224/g.28270 Transcript_19224/m.28270 type:complete len:127 (+) Transcript_19224:174-554(+)